MKIQRYEANLKSIRLIERNGTLTMVINVDAGVKGYVYRYSTMPKDAIVESFFEDFLREIEAKKLPMERESPEIEVLKKLEDAKKEYKSNKSPEYLNELQLAIEDLCYKFDERSIFKETPNLIKLLVKEGQINAKTYLRDKIPDDLYHETISQFGEYTLEALMIHVLGKAFSSIQESSIVKVSTLLGLIDQHVNTQSLLLKIKKEGKEETSKPSTKKKTAKKTRKKIDYLIASLLLEFMEQRNVIKLETLASDDKPVVKKTGEGYIQKNTFVICDFNLSNLPVRMNLPMVCMPLEWSHDGRKPILLSDLRGGYLSGPTSDMYGIALLSSRHIGNFNIELNASTYEELCSTMNGLQSQRFKVNGKLLEFIKKNRPMLERMGLLMPSILAHVNQGEVLDMLRKLYFKNTNIKKVSSVDKLIKDFAVMIQKARYEDTIITIASAFEGFIIFLAAFMDFRGRIYRSGYMNFHDRDLAKALIHFAREERESLGLSNQALDSIVATAAAFKYQKFQHPEEALQWYKEKEDVFNASDSSLISFAQDASDPFQFIAKVLSKGSEEADCTPITQDAAASAYQIMSYLLLNEEMARRTNLIPNPDGKIQDVYSSLLVEFRKFLRHRFEDKMEIIESKLDRKLIKSLFMPLIYGKTLISMDNDIRETYGQLISKKDAFSIAKLSQEFWIETFPDISNLMKLISKVSWLCSAKDSPVYYSVPYFTTKQDYKQFQKEHISIFERLTRKRRRATLSIATNNRDKRKTQLATCPNFIHQKDANIALTTIKPALRKKIPIYTVHDNFITTPLYAKLIPDMYIESFIGMGHPLHIINLFIYDNLIHPYSQTEDVLNYIDKHNPQPFPSLYLQEFLLSHSPSTEKTKWQKGVSVFLKCYEDYANAVVGNGNRWEVFRRLLVNRKQNFSVHY